MQITSDRIRLSVDVALKNTPLVDFFTGSTPIQFNGADVQYEVAFLLNGALADLSNIDHVILEVKPDPNIRSQPLMSQTLSSGSLNLALTQDQWESGDPAYEHALFTFENGLTSLNLATGDKGTFWLVITLYTTDSPAKQIPAGTGELTVVETGYNPTPPSFVATPAYYTAAQVDSRITAAGGIAGTKVNKTGDTMSGPLVFSGTTNAGIKLSNLTTTQRTALTGAAGMLVWDTTITGAMVYNGSAWKQLVTSVNSQTGAVTLNTDNVAQGSTNLYMTNTGVTGQVLTGLTGTYSTITAADTILSALGKLANYAASATGTGTVTSVALSMPGDFNVANSPVTTTGTLTVTYGNQTANTVHAGPASGGSAAPTWRALVAGDIPNIAESQVTNLTIDLAAKLALAGGTMTGPIKLYNVVATTVPIPSSGMIVYDTASTAPSFYNGSAWVNLVTATGNFLPLTGGTVTGPIVLPVSAPTGNQATSFNFVNTNYAALAGATFSGPISFSAATSFNLPNVTQPQRLALTPAAGMMVFDTTSAQPFVYTGVFWQSPLTAAGALLLSGGTMVGDITISGTTHAGFVLNSLSSTQKNALSPSAGMLVFDTTAGLPSFYSGSTWINVTAGSGLATTGGTMTGQIAFTGTGYANILMSLLTTTQQGALTPAEGMLIYNSTLHSPSWYDGSVWQQMATVGNSVQLTGPAQGMSAQLSINTTGGGLINFGGTTRIGLFLQTMTTSQITSNSPGTAGQFVYNVTTGKLNFSDGGAWRVVTST